MEAIFYVGVFVAALYVFVVAWHSMDHLGEPTEWDVRKIFR